MARGMQGVRDAAADIERRKNAGGGGTMTPWFKLKSGESAVVRFLEQGEDVNWCWVHDAQPSEGRSWGDSYPCLDQDGSGDPCPGCEERRKRSFKGFINLIRRDAPQVKKDSDGNIVKDSRGEWIFEGRADQVQIWESGIKVFELLDMKDGTYRGLTSRDFRITRKGEQLSTTWSVEPADPDGGPQPLSESDLKLAGAKPDLARFTTPHSYDETRRLLRGEKLKDVKAGESAGGVEAAQVGRVNVFMDREEG